MGGKVYKRFEGFEGFVQTPGDASKDDGLICRAIAHGIEVAEDCTECTTSFGFADGGVLDGPNYGPFSVGFLFGNFGGIRFAEDCDFAATSFL